MVNRPVYIIKVVYFLKKCSIRGKNGTVYTLTPLSFLMFYWALYLLYVFQILPLIVILSMNIIVQKSKIQKEEKLIINNCNSLEHTCTTEQNTCWYLFDEEKVNLQK